jgi:hypothetical protein
LPSLILVEKEGISIKNKYEDIGIIELENPEDIVETFIACAMDANEHGKTVGLIANKELVTYAMDESFDAFNVRKVDIEADNVAYMISIDKDGDIVVQPVTDFEDKFFKAIDIVYISVDGDVPQDIIDKCVNADKDVALFGLEDEDCDCDPCCSCDGCTNCDCNGTTISKSTSSTVSKDSDGVLNGFSVSWSDNNSEDTFCSSSYSFYSTDEKSVRKLASEFGVDVD